MPTDLSITMAIGSHRLSQQIFTASVNKDTVVLMAATTSRLENQDAIDTVIVSMLADLKETCARITEVHFLPFNPTDKRTAITYIDPSGTMHCVSKGAPEQVLNWQLLRKQEDGSGWAQICTLLHLCSITIRIIFALCFTLH